MENKNWFIDSFIFKYNNQVYIVLVKRYHEKKKKPDKFALVELEFIKKNNFQNKLITAANAVKLYVHDDEICRYFEIKKTNYSRWNIRQLFESLGQSIPTIKREDVTDSELEIMVTSLATSDAVDRDPNRRHCFAVQRNPENKQRSAYNNDLAKLTRRTLFEELQCDVDKHISFRFSTNEDDYRDNITIILNYTKNREKSRAKN